MLLRRRGWLSRSQPSERMTWYSWEVFAPLQMVLRFFFFSSRRRHTRFDCDWSSDVCSSDLGGTGGKMFVQNQGGQWREVSQSTFHDLTDIAFIGNRGVAVGLNGTILLTQN